MPAPTSPKKRMLMASSPLRRQLRGAGHHLHAIVQIGKEGVTEAVLAQLDQALLDHELVKVKVGTECPEDRFEAAERCGGELEAQVAQVLGRTVLVYRRHPEKPRWEPLPAAPAGAAPPAAPRGRGRGGGKAGAGARKPARGAPERPSGRVGRGGGRSARRGG